MSANGETRGVTLMIAPLGILAQLDAVSIEDERSMNTSGNEPAQAILAAIANANTRLDHFNYHLFLETNAPSRGPSRQVTLGGKGWTLHTPGGAEVFDGVAIFGASVCQDNGRRRWLLFEVLFMWRRDQWAVQTFANTEQEDVDGNVTLWKSALISSTTVPSAISMLDRAVAELEACIHTERVATWLKAIEPRALQ